MTALEQLKGFVPSVTLPKLLTELPSWQDVRIPKWALLPAVIPAYYVARYLWELRELGGLSQRAVFVAGADSGFGRRLVIRLVQKGIPVFAGCLTKEVRIHANFVLPGRSAISI